MIKRTQLHRILHSRSDQSKQPNRLQAQSVTHRPLGFWRRPWYKAFWSTSDPSISQAETNRTHLYRILYSRSDQSKQPSWHQAQRLSLTASGFLMKTWYKAFWSTSDPSNRSQLGMTLHSRSDQSKQPNWHQAQGVSLTASGFLMKTWYPFWSTSDPSTRPVEND